MEAPSTSNLQPHISYESRDVLGIRIDDVAPDALVDAMVGAMAARRRLVVLHANAWLMTVARNDPGLRRFFQSANIVYADGAGAVLAALVLTGFRPHRSTAPDWIDRVGHRMAAQGSSVFWLGGKAEVVARAAQNYASETGVRIAGWHHGYFDKTPGSSENQAVVAAINASGADLLVLNMGMPAQETWVQQNCAALNVPVVLTAGALVDRVAGLVDRPPRWISACGFEWLARLVLEPRRLSRRYLVGLPIFLMQIISGLPRHRLGRPRPGAVDRPSKPSR